MRQESPSCSTSFLILGVVRVPCFSPYGIFWPRGILCCKVPIHISCPLLLTGLSVFFLIDLYKLFIYSGCKPFVGFTWCQYLLSLCGLFFFTLLMVFFDEKDCFMSFCLCIPFPLHILKKHLGKCGCLLLFSRMYSSLWVYSGFNQHRDMWVFPPELLFLDCKTEPLSLTFASDLHVRVFFPSFLKD